jgi:hypothetical protein
MEASHACSITTTRYATAEIWPALEVRGACETTMKAAGYAAGVAPIARTEYPVAWMDPAIVRTEPSVTWTAPPKAWMKCPETAIEPSEPAMAAKTTEAATTEPAKAAAMETPTMEPAKATAAAKAESRRRAVQVQREAEHHGKEKRKEASARVFPARKRNWLCWGCQISGVLTEGIKATVRPRTHRP